MSSTGTPEILASLPGPTALWFEAPSAPTQQEWTAVAAVAVGV